jgi:formylglycine-generating enzyme required for sulfatase activity
MAKETWERPTAEALQQVAQNYISSCNWQSETMLIADLIESEIPEKPVHRPTQPISLKVETPLEKAIAAREFKNFLNQCAGKPTEIQKGALYFDLIKRWGQINLKEYETEYENQISKYNVNVSQTLFVEEFGIELILVEGGTFLMGHNGRDNSCKPAHQVSLESFYIGKVPVTRAQWYAVYGKKSIKNMDEPIVSVSWNEAINFIKILNAKSKFLFRLPTEAEWEFAAKGGNKSMGYWYAGSNDPDIVAWTKSNSNLKSDENSRAFSISRLYSVHKVAKRMPNELGIYDMSGNVWEWCYDFYGPYNSSEERNPTGPLTGDYRVRRGGSWDYDQIYSLAEARSGYRPYAKNVDIGFRLACSK